MNKEPLSSETGTKLPSILKNGDRRQFAEFRKDQNIENERMSQKMTKQQSSKVYKFQQRKKNYTQAFDRERRDEVVAQNGGRRTPTKSMVAEKIGELKVITRAKEAQIEKKKTVKYQLADETGSMSETSSESEEVPSHRILKSKTAINQLKSQFSQVQKRRLKDKTYTASLQREDNNVGDQQQNKAKRRLDRRSQTTQLSAHKSMSYIGSNAHQAEQIRSMIEKSLSQKVGGWKKEQQKVESEQKKLEFATIVNMKKMAANRRMSKEYEKNGKNLKLEGLFSSQNNNPEQHRSRKSSILGNSMKSSIDIDEEEIKKDQNQWKDITKKVNDQKNHKKTYIENYQVDLEYPGYYCFDSKFVPNDEELIIHLSWHILPEDTGYIIQTTYQNDDFDEKSQISQDFEGCDNCLTLKLIQPNDRGTFEIIREVQLNSNEKCPVNTHLHNNDGHHTPNYKMIIEFSKFGNFFALYEEQTSILKIYNSTDIYQCIDDIEDDKPSLSWRMSERKDLNHGKFRKANKLVFDHGEKYIGIVEDRRIIIFSIQPNDKGKMMQEYPIDEQYKTIEDVIIDSQREEKPQNYAYGTQIACKQSHRNVIDIFDINDQEVEVRSITFTKEGKQLIVKISEDFQKVMFSSGDEHYILDGRSQDSFPQIKNKIVRNVINYDNTFYFASCKDYDRDIDILNSKDETFNASIKRSIEPGLITVFDKEIKNIGGRDIMQILVNIGDNMYLEKIDMEKSKNPSDRFGAHIASNVDKYYFAYSFNWPYFSYANRLNFVYIMNAFNPQFIQRYELPDDEVRVLQTFLTDTHDLYIITMTYDNFYNIYRIDLDAREPYLIGPILKYSFEDVERGELMSFHVRGSSKKEKINLNKQLMVFMIHGKTLYNWVNKKDTEEFDPDEDEIVAIDWHCSPFKYYSDEIIFYKTTQPIQIDENKRSQENKKTVLHSVIKMIQIEFGTFKPTDVYEDKKQMKSEILNFGIDIIKNRLLILTGVKNNKDKRDKFISLFDIDSENMLYSKQIHDMELIGRLKSNLYIFIDGHIYYGNQVIKIRYDIIDQKMKFSQNQVFDYYNDVLFLKEHFYVQSGTPFQCSLYHRLAYIVRNNKELKPRRLLILPYLHERKIMLNRRHDSNQFYTLFRHMHKNYVLCICLSDFKMYIYTETGILVDRIQYKDLAKEIGKPIAVSENGLILLFKMGETSKEISVVRVCIDKMEKLKTVNIKREVEKYLEVAHKTSENKEQQQKFTQLNYFWKHYLKKLDQMDLVEIEILLNDNGDMLIRLRPTNEYAHKVRKEQQRNSLAHDHLDHEFDDTQFASAQIKCSFYFYIPNKYENISENEYKTNFQQSVSASGEKTPHHQYFDENDNQRFIFFDDFKFNNDCENNIKGITMNNFYLFFWNNCRVWKLELSTSTLTEINLYISEEEHQSSIKSVLVSSNAKQIAIRVQEASKMDCLMFWNLEKDLESDSFDVDKDAQFFQDKKGNPFLIQNDYIINCEQICKLKCYKLQASNFTTMKNFGFSKGIRVDDENHNFIIFRNYISLSFSYMTFVIMENFEKQGYILEDFLFDLEGYDLILNRETIFQAKSHLVTKDYDKLQFILNNYFEHDPILLEQLFYRNGQHEAPIHLALNTNNTRMVNLILLYMSKVAQTGFQFNVIKDIYKDLVTYKNFSSYLINSPFQTIQMLNKQTLKLKKSKVEKNEMTDIIMTMESSISYVDEAFFHEKMGEEKFVENEQQGGDTRHQFQQGVKRLQLVQDDIKTFAVKVQGIKADWILNEPDGIVFLQEMLKQQNKELFMTSYVKIITQYLFSQYRDAIWHKLLPYYLIHLAVITAQIHVAENYRNGLHDTLLDATNPNFSQNGARYVTHTMIETLFVDDHSIYKPELQIKGRVYTIFVIIQGIITMFNTWIFVKQTWHLKTLVFIRKWSYIDLAIIILNIVIVSSLVFHIEIWVLRIIEAFLTLLIYLKSLYFLRLVGNIAPIIDIIFVILNDIGHFMLIFTIGLIAFSHAFYIIGLNQLQNAEKEEFECQQSGISAIECHERYDIFDLIPYRTFGRAFVHVYLSSLGEFDANGYMDKNGKNSDMTVYLFILFLLMSFFMCIHLLNMLIAMMGDSFQKNNEMADAKKMISQLNFVVDNWWIDPICNKEKIVYIIAAFAIHDQDKSQSKIDYLQTDVDEMKNMQVKLMDELKLIQAHLGRDKAAYR